MTIPNSFSLSSSHQLHSQDIKSTISTPDNIIITASRDSTVNYNFNSTIFNSHSHFVNSLAFLPPSTSLPLLIISGSFDKTIHIHSLDSPEPLFILTGHTDNISCLDTSSDHTIISGSWDHSVKLWNFSKNSCSCSLTIDAHSLAVWDVLSMDNGFILSASADKSIKLWNSTGKLIHTYTGHTDAVRCLTKLPTIGFASASNDATIRIWSLAGDCLHELSGHSSFIYSISVFPSTNEIISCGEDRTVKVWKDYSCIQTIPQPCTSLWSITAMNNGDFCVGGSDGILRVFTRSKERMADDATTLEFQKSIENSSIPSNQLGDLDTTKIDGIDALDVPGTAEGQVKVVKTTAGVEAYQWSSSACQWQKVGQVVDAIGSNRKQLYQGKEYDFVFSIDMADGMPHLKLPYNVNENPYQAAQNFILKHELPQDYLDQVAQFIITNSKGVTLGNTSTSTNVDPYTGGNRYIPEGHTTVPQSSEFFPCTQYTVFKSGNLNAILKKIKEFNQDKSMSTPLKDEQLKSLENVVDSLSKQKFVSSADIELVSFIAFKWKNEYRFPGLDLFSTMMLYSEASLNDFQMLDYISNISFNGDKISQTNAMLELRILCNIFTKPNGLLYVTSKLDSILNLMAKSPMASANKNLRIAIATLFVNLSIFLSKKSNMSIKLNFVELLINFIDSEEETESLMRSLASLGTILGTFNVKSEKHSINLIANCVSRIKKFSDAKLQRLAEDVAKLL